MSNKSKELEKKYKKMDEDGARIKDMADDPDDSFANLEVRVGDVKDARDKLSEDFGVEGRVRVRNRAFVPRPKGGEPRKEGKITEKVMGREPGRREGGKNGGAEKKGYEKAGEDGRAKGSNGEEGGEDGEEEWEKDEDEENNDGDTDKEEGDDLEEDAVEEEGTKKEWIFLGHHKDEEGENTPFEMTKI